jgi:hypothetical protein
LKTFNVKFLYTQTMTCTVAAECWEQALQLADVQADRTGVSLHTFVRQFDVGSPKGDDPRLLKPDLTDMGTFEYLLIEENK